MIERKQYILMEVVGNGGEKFDDRYDWWLCRWSEYKRFLDAMLEDVEPGKPVNIQFTFLEMTDDEHAAYCEEHGIEWE